MLFRKEICQFLQKEVGQQVTNLGKGYVSLIFFREKKPKSDGLILNLKKIDQNMVY